MGTIDLSKREGPYMGLSQDKVVEYPNGEKLRFLLYGAYNAMGLIGSECNGVCVLDENRRSVVADEIARIDSGYFGPSKSQVMAFAMLTEMEFSQLQTALAESGRARYIPGA
jgi:hypothetical protein